MKRSVKTKEYDMEIDLYNAMYEILRHHNYDLGKLDNSIGEVREQIKEAYGESTSDHLDYYNTVINSI